MEKELIDALTEALREAAIAQMACKKVKECLDELMIASEPFANGKSKDALNLKMYLELIRVRLNIVSEVKKDIL